MDELFWCVTQCGNPNNDFRPSQLGRFRTYHTRHVPGHLGQCFGSKNTAETLAELLNLAVS